MRKSGSTKDIIKTYRKKYKNIKEIECTQYVCEIKSNYLERLDTSVQPEESKIKAQTKGTILHYNFTFLK